MNFEPKEKLSAKIFADASKLHKPVIFWAALSFFYVEGDIHLNLVATDNGMGIQTPWGVPIIGMTEEKFLTALAIILGYFWFRFSSLMFLSYSFRMAELSQELNSQEHQSAPHWQSSISDAREAFYYLLHHFYENFLKRISYAMYNLLYYLVPIFLPLGAGGYSLYLLMHELRYLP